MHLGEDVEVVHDDELGIAYTFRNDL